MIQAIQAPPTPHDAAGRRLVLLAALLGACTGQIAKNKAGPAEGDSPSPVAGMGGGGTSSDAGTNSDARSAAMPASPALMAPLPLARRLTAGELSASVRAIFGVAPVELAMLPEDPVVDGFDNNAAALSVSTSQLEIYRTVAAAIARDALAGDHRAATLGCDIAADRDGCLRSFIDRIARRVYRRAITPSEKADLLTLAGAAAKESDPTAGAALVIEGLLSSPSFLYRIDLGVGATGQTRTLSGYEMASRLSFLLLGASPDDPLLDAAATGKLDSADGVAKKARELLGDPRAHPALQGFFVQWLRLRELARVEHAAAAYPQWNAALRASMLEESRRLVDDFAFAPRGFLDVLTAPYSYLDSTLATLYGLPAPSTPWARVDFGSGMSRRGLLTQGSVLAVTARSEELAPILRGKYVRDVLLCDPPPPPPANVPDLPATGATLTVREKLAAHRTNPTCAACHTDLDPIGFGFERYSAIGVYRDKDEQGHALTGQGTLTRIDPGAGDFVGPIELGMRLHEATATAACVVKQLFRYAHGRTEETSDEPALKALTTAFRSGSFSFPELLVTLVSHPTFRTITAPAPPAGGVCQ